MRLPGFGRTLPMSSKVLFWVGAALALGSFLAVRGEVARAEQAQRAVGPRVDAVIAARDLAAGAVIGPADVRLAEVPPVYLPPGAVSSTAAAVGQVTGGGGLAGQGLGDAPLGGGRYAAAVEARNRAVT